MKPATDNSKEKSSRIDLMFRALKYKNFRLFVGGQSLSLIGTWIQMVAMTWLVYRLTNSALMLGIVGFSGQIPSFLLGPLAGVLADRWNRHRILLITQSLALLQALILSFIVFTNVVVVWHLIVLSISLGIINAFDMPIRQSFVVEMIENQKQDLGNAIALNSTMVNAARLAGPSIAGILVASFGEGWCFLINAISYVAVVISLLRMKLDPYEANPSKKNIIGELKEGFSYTFNFLPIRYLIMLLALVSVASTPVTLLAPVIATKYLHGNASTYGFLIGAYGCGALMGAAYLLNKKNVLGLGKLIAIAVILFSVGAISFSFSRFFPLSILLLMITGLGMMLEVASTNTMIQTIVEEDKRGRVMSFYAMAFRGMSPFGSIFGGGLATLIGAPLTLLSGGIICLIGAGVYIKKLPMLRPLIRPIYVRMGILPEVAQGVQTASQITSPTVD
ncbi:MAG: MFS transporter [Ignavibacteriaceae bacterium]